jgi:hypothetical protein
MAELLSNPAMQKWLHGTKHTGVQEGPRPATPLFTCSTQHTLL